MNSNKIEVLDHGYVKIIEHWGSDERVIEAARMSTQKGFQGWGPLQYCVDCDVEFEIREIGHRPECPKCGNEIYKEKPGDERLLKYLWTHKHTGPFEFAGAVFEVQAPIFVFREWHRHRTQSFNEMSARYAPLPDVNYVPTVERIMLGGGHLTKQAGSIEGSESISEKTARNMINILESHYTDAQIAYEVMLNCGIPKELARLCLPVGRYSRMRASANLWNWLRFLSLRMDEHAQWEIRQYANVVYQMLGLKFPRTMSLFSEGLK